MFDMLPTKYCAIVALFPVIYTLKYTSQSPADSDNEVKFALTPLVNAIPLPTSIEEDINSPTLPAAAALFVIVPIIPLVLEKDKLVALAAPMVGVTNVGDVASTILPDPVTELPNAVTVPLVGSVSAVVPVTVRVVPKAPLRDKFPPRVIVFPVLLTPVPPYWPATVLPCHVPDAIVPTVVSDDVTTLEASVVPVILAAATLPALPDTEPVIVAVTVSAASVPTLVSEEETTLLASAVPVNVPAAAATVIGAVPSKLTPLIARGVCNAVAVAALPVVEPEDPDTLPVTLPVRLPVTLPDKFPVTLPVNAPVNPVFAVIVVPVIAEGVTPPITAPFIVPPVIAGEVSNLFESVCIAVSVAIVSPPIAPELAANEVNVPAAGVIPPITVPSMVPPVISTDSGDKPPKNKLIWSISIFNADCILSALTGCVIRGMVAISRRFLLRYRR